MKLSELPRPDGGSAPFLAGIRVLIEPWIPKGKAYLVNDAELYVQSLDDDITEIVRLTLPRPVAVLQAEYRALKFYER